MQASPKIRNVSYPWTATIRPRITDVCDDGAGNYYANIAGHNSVLTDTTVWFPVFQTPPAPYPEIDKTAADDFSGEDPNFFIDLSESDIPAFPTKFMVYVDQQGDGGWLPMPNPAYDPVAKQLNNVDSPADFPNELIKIFVG